MNIQIHGISRSGKDYLIEHLVKTLNAKHNNTLMFLKGSETLRKLSIEHFNIPLSDTTEEQKNQLRLLFCPYLAEFARTSKNKNIIVDGHYCFPIDNKLVTSFSKDERGAFDVFFYLDTPAEKIIENAQKGDHNEQIAEMSIEEINNWKETEIQGLKNSLLEIDKELIVLDNNIEDITAFFEYILLTQKDLEWNAKTIASQMILDNKEIINKYAKIIVLDCDKTISDNDTTYDFCEKMEIEKLKNQNLKNFF